MKKLTYLGILFIALIQFGCQKDPLSYIHSDKWNNQRNVKSIKFEHQVGQAEINRVDSVTGNITVTINVGAVPDLSNISIDQLVLSYDAKANVSEGDALNFNNESQSDSLMVTSPTGKTRKYTVKATSFTETLLGTWEISSLTLYGGTGPQYGGGSVFPLSSKSGVWPSEEGPSVELDNTLIFKLSGITDDGNTYGTVTNDAGSNGKYANFIFNGKKKADVNHFYRKIPKGEGQWKRNYNTGTITFTFPDSSTTSASFVGSGTSDLGNGLSKTTENHAFKFQLNGADDYDNIYTNYDKIVKRPRIYWVDIKKEQ